METASSQRRQAIFRFDDTFIAKLKYYALKEDKSLNAYVESVLRSDIERRESLPNLTLSKTFSPEVERIHGALAGKISKKDLEDDDRLAYLLNR